MELRRTPLFDRHVQLGARLVPFSGWEMPVQYSSIIEEHRAVREDVGLFDVSHMGEIVVRGAGALALLESLCCNTVAALQTGQVQYNAILNERGGIVDDLTIYRVREDEFFVVSNAANYEKVFAHLKSFAKNDVELVNESDNWGLLALQGPKAADVIRSIHPPCADIDYYYFDEFEWEGARLRYSRTGYTGTDGFEFYTPAGVAPAFWDALLATGAKANIKPAGLGARDILRLEAGMPLWGNELNEDRTPVESNIAWIVKEKEPPYLGYDRIMEQKRNGPPGRVLRFVMREKGGVPRGGFAVYDAAGEKRIGEVLSGAHSPVLQNGIGTAYLPVEYAAPETEILIEIRNRRLKAAVHKGPFIQKTSGKIG